MTQRRALFLALSIGSLLIGCAVEDKIDPMVEEGEDFSGQGGDDGNGNGPDMDDEGVDVLPTYPTAHPRIFMAANKARLQASLAANTQAATRFKAVADNWVNGGNVWGFEIWNAALLGQLTADPKYCAKSVAEVEANVVAEEAKIVSGAQPIVAQDSYLEIGKVIGDLALVYDWCFDVVTPAQKTRWLKYANQAVWNVWNHTQAIWGTTPRAWTGWSVNNPSNNYFYSFLRATMLLGLAAHGEDTQATGWLAQFRDTKVLGQLVPTFESQLVGGGSREGTAYGVSHRGLFHLYDIWFATTGEKLQAKTKHARQSMRTFIHQTMPTLDKFVPTGDQPRDMTAAFYDYQRNYLQELIELYPNDPVSARAKAMLDGSNLPMMARPELMVYDFIYDNTAVTAQPLDLGTAHYASGIGQVYARSGWDRAATWVNLTAGAYTESHAHQDQGSLQIFKEGWLAADGVLGSMNGIIQDTTSHSLVRITSGGTTVKQHVGTSSQLVGLHSGSDWLYAAADVTAAYKGNAAISKVQREMVFIKPNTVIVYDRVATAAGTSQIWQVASPTRPTVSGATATFAGAHSLTVQRLAPAAASSAAYDLVNTTGYRTGHRLDTTVAGGDVRYLHVLSLDGGVTSATASGDSTVTVAMTNGQTATVAFTRDDIGASLTYGGATTTLAAGIDALPQ